MTVPRNAPTSPSDSSYGRHPHPEPPDLTRYVWIGLAVLAVVITALTYR